MSPFPNIQLPFNSSCLWATTHDDLSALYNSSYTGAVTTRTACSVDNGFPHDDRTHQYTFFSITSQQTLPKPTTTYGNTTCPHSLSKQKVQEISTLNTLGYSPYSLRFYVESVKKIQADANTIHKPVIFSVAGSSSTILACYSLLARNHKPAVRPWEIWCMEINLSCPNISGAPPPAYSRSELTRLVSEVSEGVRSLIVRAKRQLERAGKDPKTVKQILMGWDIPIGLKLPPYTHATQFSDLVETICVENSKSSSLEHEQSSIGTTSENGIRAEALVNASGNNYPRPSSTIDPTILIAKMSNQLDTTLAEDLAISLSLDDALSQSPSTSSSPEVWQTLKHPFPISFLTSTNTLGSCLHLSASKVEANYEPDWLPTLASADESGLGGLAGSSIHPLSLGNVKNLKDRLKTNKDSQRVALVGVGGVSDAAGCKRMKAAGADAVALATALGIGGVEVFEKIAMHLFNDEIEDIDAASNMSES